MLQIRSYTTDMQHDMVNLYKPLFVLHRQNKKQNRSLAFLSHPLLRTHSHNFANLEENIKSN